MQSSQKFGKYFIKRSVKDPKILAIQIISVELLLSVSTSSFDDTACFQSIPNELLIGIEIVILYFVRRPIRQF
ncbi:MAG: hypothetical protein M3311_08260, partial [Thermoproteota archaeon]|nr:hypothetical protein [Thermoproteota archaeon]